MAFGVGGVVWNIGGWEFDLCLLLAGWVAGGEVGGERVFEVLFLHLIDERWKRGEGGENMVVYRECDLGRLLERGGEGYTEELSWANKESDVALIREIVVMFQCCY